jgi:hypothetical protein
MTELELKAKAYDLIAQIQFCQTELAKINAELEKLALDKAKKEK